MEVPPHHESWKDWFQQYGPKLLLCARQWTRSLADAEDVVQEAFTRFWRHQRKLGGEPMGLVLTSVRRAAWDLARRNQRRSEREQLADETGGVDEPPFFEAENGLAEERRLVLEAALRRLPAEQREVLVLKIWGERTFEQIAEQTGVPPNTAASRYRYALVALRKELNPALCHE